jgi:hypothetical protein
VFQFTGFTIITKSHVKIGTTLVCMPIGAMLSFIAFFFQKLCAYFNIVTEVTLLAIGASTHGLELVARLNFGFIVRMRTVFSKFTFAMNKLFADSIGGELIMIGNNGSSLFRIGSLIKRIVVSIRMLITLIVLIWIA